MPLIPKDKILKFKDFDDYFLEHNSSEYNREFEKKALKQTFYGPHYSKTNFAFNFFTPVTAPIGLTAFSIFAIGIAVIQTIKSIVDLCHDPKNTNSTRSAESLESIKKAGAGFWRGLISALLIAISPLIALASLVGSSIASLAEKCAPAPAM